ncbi:protein FAM92A-like isoform X1 [Nilaparvata lugens]|uniref:protein FAM92A-like isoform X1 n=2 Tax=Nilaparvata lugens TaxID=108931 RepID=UPI00193DEC3F|nr:protein FAM92A-like isoform X1 [Nilaparvata lugens]
MNIVKITRHENAACEQQAKFANDRIASVEKTFSELCSVMAGYTRKVARVRDMNDNLAKNLHSYSESEKINRSLKQGLGDFSNTLVEIGDYRNIETQRLDKRVVQELVQYESVCRNAKDEVKNIFSARDRELAWKKQLERVKERNPYNRQQITTAESELVKASVEVSRTQKALEEQMDLFEKKKLHDLKAILMDFIAIEIESHARVIELFTRGYQELMQINEDYDLEDFQRERGITETSFQDSLKMSETASRIETVRKTSMRNTSLLSTLLAKQKKVPKKSSSGNSSSLTTTTTSNSADLVEDLKQDDYEMDEDDEDQISVSDGESSSLLSYDNVANEVDRSKNQK